MVNKHLNRLIKQRDSLEKSFDNLIEITNKDIDKKETDESSEEISLKDEKIKTYAEGLLKSHTTIEQIVSMLNKVEIEIDSIENPNKETTAKKNDGNPLNQNLK